MQEWLLYGTKGKKKKKKFANVKVLQTNNRDSLLKLLFIQDGLYGRREIMDWGALKINALFSKMQRG